MLTPKVADGFDALQRLSISWLGMGGREDGRGQVQLSYIALDRVL